MAHTLDLVRLLLGGLLLLYASWRDLQERRVSNSVWILGTIFALPLLGIDLLVTGRADWLDLAGVGLVIVAAYVMWYFHILAGGADAKAIMMLAVLLPVPIEWDLAGHAFPQWPSPFPAAIVVLANAVLAFLPAPLLFFLVNFVRGQVKFPAMLLGYRKDLEEAARSHVWIVEHAADGGLRQVLWASRLGREDYEANVERLRARGVKRVWVTPKIPFIVPLFFGFVSAFTLGDLLTQWIAVPLAEAVRGA